ncbi:haloacid dehalogenase-like hydrolase, putative [Plasmodium vivax]|uniref:Hydrolase, putative n=1 Tax=Plasmodium vivax (strain Salvador I) TaxID=126793 RepID=A5K061_PLAVS|nr:hydrolase, putative [Plasmodium vivax]EDL47622.1 hydrolase, putative [Plasmodium vivax]CAI7723599.1 haloacid dehalogenase-like hydrolase, putative [Plasmodium vivax]|eukprot:XP_001617349.1 hydrolase [Plasmodium vivax Sal-1]
MMTPARASHKNVYIQKKYRELLKYKESDECLNDLLQRNSVKLIAIDIDGTLADDDSKISDENLNAIEVAKRLGIKVILATGKLHNFAMRMFTQKQKDTYEIEKMDGVYSHGAYLNIRGVDYVYRKFNMIDIEFILFALSSHNALKNAIFVTPNVVYVFNDDPEFKKQYAVSELGADSPVNASSVKSLDKRHNAVLLTNVKDILMIGDIVSIEIYEKIHPEQEPFKELHTEVFPELENRFKIYVPPNKEKLVLSPINTSKIQTIQLYAQFYDIPLNHILSIGNDNNDLEMLASTGYSVVVKGSTKPALKVARCISTKTNNENAVANIIFKVITGRHF